ncbi:protein of unknown function (plasmid) [Cupriavidus taiwanensis]|uniref:Uncharacterized protein n=1 Tax=Cupriavidus taiwanensis TaxID=164546 RepID=A0A375IV25_9BURK|nr:hypothetical protein CT19425_U600092 [Cupriavidus taiwanensis]SPK77025.1 protein of unknown function [Cupriavidus taiwanensis]
MLKRTLTTGDFWSKGRRDPHRARTRWDRESGRALFLCLSGGASVFDQESNAPLIWIIPASAS